MLILDDVHWADAPTLQLLQFIARYVPDSKILLVGTYRDTELSRRHPLSETLAELNRERNYQRLTLRGLEETEITQLVNALSTNPASTETTAEKDEPKVGYRVGNLAPDFTITTTDGRTVNRDDILAEDKPFILYFFATW